MLCLSFKLETYGSSSPKHREKLSSFHVFTAVSRILSTGGGGDRSVVSQRALQVSRPRGKLRGLAWGG